MGVERGRRSLRIQNPCSEQGPDAEFGIPQEQGDENKEG
jgi:hypothetical protein